MNPETFTAYDIQNMDMADYIKIREKLIMAGTSLSPQQFREAESLTIEADPPPPERWTFKSF